MLITADWVLPVSRPPIRNGAVVVEHGRVTAVGLADDLTGLDDGRDRHHFPGCAVVPGLVNAHTHLSLTAIGGLLAPAAFEQWLPRLVAAMNTWEKSDHAASAALGALQSLQAGVTVVGDITYGPEAPSAASDAGLGGVFFWEVLGISAPTLFAELERREFPTDSASCGPRLRCGLSPHSPYTCDPRLIAAVHEAAADFGIPLAIHVAESAAEVQLLKDGAGPLADIAARVAPHFEPPQCSSVTYLDHLGALDGATVVHACHVGPSDIARLAATARGVVTCPRSNAFLSNPLAPVARLLRAGVPVGIGTDSAASNEDLDLMEDVRALHAHCPSIPPRTLIEMVTAMGAIALGLEDRFGILEPGMQADLAIFELGETDDPETDFIRTAGSASLRAVATSGVWRVLEGRPTAPVERTMIEAQAARIRAEHALGQG